MLIKLIKKYAVLLLQISKHGTHGLPHIKNWGPLQKKGRPLHPQIFATFSKA